ncbi:MAG TPA: DUF6529 family protein [Micromonosporaceae bacterium]|jgi:hypothetical protein
MSQVAAPPPRTHAGRILVFCLIGALVSVALGVYGRVHTGTATGISVPGFTDLISFKTWLASVAALLAVVQLVSALVMYGKLGSNAPTWIGGLHRWSGRLAFLATVPVAVSCLYALGFETFTTRELVHGILGCLFFGVFTIKMLVLTQRGLRGWVLPLLGGLVFVILIGVWLTSSLWYFQTFGARF